MLDAADRLLLAANRFACAALLAAMSVLVFGNVVGRYVFGVSFAWVEEASRYMMIWCAFLGAGLALRAGAHIAVEMLPDALPRIPAMLLRATIALIVGLFLAVLVWLGLEYAAFARLQRTPVLRLSMGIVYLAIPIGCALCLLHLLAMLPGFVRRAASDDEKVRAAELGSAL
jgi:TRAP-type C4-dicarboxylate transport system permease small subunit